MPWREVCPWTRRCVWSQRLGSKNTGMTELCGELPDEPQDRCESLLHYRQHGPQGLHDFARTAPSALGDLEHAGRSHPCAAPAHPAGARELRADLRNAIRTKLGRCRAPLAGLLRAMG